MFWNAFFRPAWRVITERKRTTLVERHQKVAIGQSPVCISFLRSYLTNPVVDRRLFSMRR